MLSDPIDIPQGRRNIASFAFLAVSIRRQRRLLPFVVTAGSVWMSIFLPTTSGFSYIFAE